MGVKDVITGRLLASANRKFSDAQVADTLHLLVMHGLEGGANTIHIEPHDRYVLVRYRIDGALRGVHKLPREASDLLMRQLKVLSDLEPNDSRTPQEGQYSTEIGGQNLHVRLSIMPVLGGEKAVLHLRPEQASPLELEKLGFWGWGLDAIHEALARPNGLILVTGPKHSGKTTTMYSMLELVNSPTYSIATIEEHSTHRLAGVSQSYVHPKSGTTMLDGLRAVLHQDPNIILLGGLPDQKTAELAVQSATNGHLLLAEMHNENAVTSVLHLRAMGVEPFLLATALRVSVAQRLVRRLCPDCRERYTLDEARTSKLEEAFGITSTAARARVVRLEQEAAQAGLTSGEPGFNTPDGLPRLWRPGKGGCETCSHNGFKGRLALTEVLVNNDGLQKQLLSRRTLTASELHKAALKDDFVPMGLDGLIKALCGLTTITEVLRAAGRVNA